MCGWRLPGESTLVLVGRWDQECQEVHGEQDLEVPAGCPTKVVGDCEEFELPQRPSPKREMVVFQVGRAKAELSTLDVWSNADTRSLSGVVL